MDITVTTPETSTSIDKALVKASKRIAHSREDELIDFWIRVADDYIRDRTATGIMQRTLVLKISRVLPVFQLPFPPVASLVSAKYMIDGQTETVLNVSTDLKKTVVEMLPTYTIAALDETEYDGSMEITYISGYALPAEVPSVLRQASLLLTAHYCNSREAEYLDPRAIQIERKIAFGVDELVSRLRIPPVNEAINGGY